MKNHLFLLVFLLTQIGLFAQKGGKLPESLAMETLAGQTVDLKDYVAKDAKVTVVNFWATWCKPCKQELDNIQADYLADWKEKYDIRFVAVSMDNSGTKPKVKGEVDTHGWEYEVLCNPDNSAYQALGFNSCPYTVLLDANGRIVYKHTGYKAGDEEELEKEIKKAKEANVETTIETTKTEKVEETVVNKETEAAENLRLAKKTVKEAELKEDLKKLAENIKAYQALLKDAEKAEDFNKQLEELKKIFSNFQIDTFSN